MRGLPGLAMVEEFRDTVEGGPEGSTNTRHTIAPAFIEEVFGPIPIPFGSDHRGFIGGIGRSEHFGQVFLESTVVDLHPGHRQWDRVYMVDI